MAKIFGIWKSRRSSGGRLYSTAILLLVGLWCLVVRSGSGQSTPKSAAELIASISHADHPQPELRLFTCGETEQVRSERQLARDLVRLGKLAIPDLDQALDSIERDGEASPLYSKAGWLLYAYVRIEGPQAAPRLVRLRISPTFTSLRLTLDYAGALSLNVTSYVSSFRPPGSVLICRRREPRDALDQLILSL